MFSYCEYLLTKCSKSVTLTLKYEVSFLSCLCDYSGNTPFTYVFLSFEIVAFEQSKWKMKIKVTIQVFRVRRHVVRVGYRGWAIIRIFEAIH
jgi:hypothetical protein